MKKYYRLIIVIIAALALVAAAAVIVSAAARRQPLGSSDAGSGQTLPASQSEEAVPDSSGTQTDPAAVTDKSGGSDTVTPVSGESLSSVGSYEPQPPLIPDNAYEKPGKSDSKLYTLDGKESIFTYRYSVNNAPEGWIDSSKAPEAVRDVYMNGENASLTFDAGTGELISYRAASLLSSASAAARSDSELISILQNSLEQLKAGRKDAVLKKVSFNSGMYTVCATDASGGGITAYIDGDGSLKSLYLTAGLFTPDDAQRLLAQQKINAHLDTLPKNGGRYYTVEKTEYSDISGVKTAVFTVASLIPSPYSDEPARLMMIFSCAVG